MKRGLSAAGAALVLALSAGAVEAQMVTPGNPVTGQVAQGRAACYTLATTPGSLWRINLSGTMDTFLQIGRGPCESMKVDKSNDDVLFLLNRGSRLDIAAGGGAYTIKVQGLAGAAGSYTLTVEQRPGVATSGMLPAAGKAGDWLTAGWTPDSASTVPNRQAADLPHGTLFKDCEDICPEMVALRAGSFTMGSLDTEEGRTAQEGPRHPVVISNAFAIGRHEVTFAEWDACVADGGCLHKPSDQGWGRGRRPVVDVSWNDAMEYVSWLSEKTGHRYTLPSESEWEYAARAGGSTPWHTGNAILTDDANILNQFRKTVPVGGYAPNAFGLHDVHGNVSEWTLDCLDTGYVGVPKDGGAATSGDCANNRLARGGAFDVEPSGARSAARAAGAQVNRFPGTGFRVARAL